MMVNPNEIWLECRLAEYILNTIHMVTAEDRPKAPN